MFQFTVNPSNLIIIASVVIGVTFSLLLILTQRINRKANILLGLLSLIIVFWNIWVLSVDFKVFSSYPSFCLLPLNFSLALGPLLYLYTRKMTDPALKLNWKDSVHFIPLLLEISVHFIIASQAISSGIRPVNTVAFATLIPIIQLLAISSIIFYSLKSLNEIRTYHKWVKSNYSNDADYHLKWLYRLIIIFGALWLLLVPYTAVDYFFYDFQLSIADYYPIYILMSVITIWINAEAFLKPEVIFIEARSKEELSTSEEGENLLTEVSKLEREMEENRYFLDSELTLRKLAEQLELHPNQLSKIINSGIGKNFADFINSYRVQSVISKLNDPNYSHITLLGISFESGFNSKTTFNRVFKNMTGKTPLEYKKTSTKV